MLCERQHSILELLLWRLLAALDVSLQAAANVFQNVDWGNVFIFLSFWKALLSSLKSAGSLWWFPGAHLGGAVLMAGGGQRSSFAEQQGPEGWDQCRELPGSCPSCFLIARAGGWGCALTRCMSVQPQPITSSHSAAPVISNALFLTAS